jgi:hypothetical protein
VQGRKDSTAAVNSRYHRLSERCVVASVDNLENETEVLCEQLWQNTCIQEGEEDDEEGEEQDEKDEEERKRVREIRFCIERERE